MRLSRPRISKRRNGANGENGEESAVRHDSPVCRWARASRARGWEWDPGQHTSGTALIRLRVARDPTPPSAGPTARRQRQTACSSNVAAPFSPLASFLRVEIRGLHSLQLSLSISQPPIQSRRFVPLRGCAIGRSSPSSARRSSVCRRTDSPRSADDSPSSPSARR